MKVFTDKHEKIMSKVNKFELLCSGPNLFFSKRDGKTVKEYFGKIVGKKNYEKVFNRMFSAVIVQNADDFSAEFFLKKRKTRSKEHPKSFVLKQGMQSFMKALTQSENLTLHSRQRVVSVQKEEEYLVKTEDGNEYRTKDIAFAVAPSVAGEMLSSVSPNLSAHLREYQTKNITSRTVVLPKEQVTFDFVSFVIPLQGACLAMVTRDVMPHHESRGFSFHFEEDHKSQSDQEQFMSELLGVKPDIISNTKVAKHQLPVLELGHGTRIEKIKQLAEKDNIYLTGNYFNGLSLEDCVERSTQEFERYLNK